MSMTTEPKKSNPLWMWLFNPFMYIAGWQALVIGLIGVVNLPASVCNLLGADVYEIPSPDWSSGLLMTEDPLQHQISKFVGGESSYFLITVGAGNIAKALKNCKKPAGALCDDVINSADEVVDLGKGAKPKELNRPYIRKAVRKEVENRAEKSLDGKFLDANEKTPINGKYDLGHKPGNEFWREKGNARNEGLNQKQFNDKMNNPDKYQIEKPSLNRSHKYEQK